MSTEALRKAVESLNREIADPEDCTAWQTILQALRDQESALATHRANYDALVIRLGEVTARLEAADGLLRDCISDDVEAEHFLGADLLARVTTHLKAVDHV